MSTRMLTDDFWNEIEFLLLLPVNVTVDTGRLKLAYALIDASGRRRH